MSGSSSKFLVLEIFLHEGRFHGAPEWPPSPARVFQALVAGCAEGERVPEDHGVTLIWLESLPPPQIGAPTAVHGEEINIWVPNNDLDSQDGDPNRAPNIKTGKTIQPYIFDPQIPFLYIWEIPAEDERAEAFSRLASGIYQFGRGLDLAWARSRSISESEFSALQGRYAGKLYRPSERRGTYELPCPTSGSLQSLQRRFRQLTQRFESETEGRKRILAFSQPPKPRFRIYGYNAAPLRRVFELLGLDGGFAANPIESVVSLVETIRDAAAIRLSKAMPESADLIERTLVGREAGRQEPSLEHRVRLIPLPSTGHEEVVPALRRLLVEVPVGHRGLSSEDIYWAFSGLRIPKPSRPEECIQLVPSDNTAMADRYRAEPHGSRVWRTMTPSALPALAGRRRLDPARPVEERKGASERAQEEARANFAVRQALRHAGVRAPPRKIEVQREPFQKRGKRAELFERKPRFPKERLWHVKVEFEESISGPLVLGDGRFLGLGVMAPAPQAREIIIYRIVDGLSPNPDPLEVVRAFRRAIQARTQAMLGRNKAIPSYISGHQEDGEPAREHRHIAISFDPIQKRLLLVPPCYLGSSSSPQADKDHELLERALAGLSEVRAGRAGMLVVERVAIDFTDDPLLQPARRWISATAYQVTRHAKRGDPHRAVVENIHAECRRLSLPLPEVNVTEARGVSGLGLVARAVLDFPKAVKGPLLMGRSFHKGGGLFVAHQGS